VAQDHDGWRRFVGAVFFTGNLRSLISYFTNSEVITQRSNFPRKPLIGSNITTTCQVFFAHSY
jgi:hypothetical protein